MKTIILFAAVLIMSAMAFTGCTKEDVLQPKGSNPTVMKDEGGETPPQKPPRPPL